MAVKLCGECPLFIKKKDAVSFIKDRSRVTGMMPTFVQRIEPYRFFDETIEDRQLIDSLVIDAVLNLFDLASNERDILWTST